MTRRAILTLPAALAAMAATRSVRYAICSGSFAGQTLSEMCASAKRLGYVALELEPGMISSDPAALSKADRAELRKAIRTSGIEFVGLHGFLRVPQGMHLTTADQELRTRTWNYFDRMIDLAADLGDRPLMVLGQGKQREATGAVTPRDAVARLTEGLAKLVPHAARRGVTILLEPLAPHLCNVINTLDEVMTVVREVGSPALQTMLDTHNTAGERERPGALIRRHFSHIRHIHLNEMDGRTPGSGSFPFSEVMDTLQAMNYAGYVSVELFDFKPDGETVARRSIEFLKGLSGTRQ